MIFPLDETLTRLLPMLPPALVHGHAISSARAIAAVAPEAISCACFESRLGEDPQVDFIACVMAADGGRAALSRPRPPGEPPPAGLEGREWERVFEFCEGWSAPGSILYDKVPFIWLEFDIKGRVISAPPPFLIFCLQPGFMSGPIREARPTGRVDARSIEEHRELMKRGLEPLLDRPLSRAAEENLVACVRELPSSGHILHLAPHNTRGLDSYRLVLSISGGELPEYLRRIGWRGSMDQVGDLLSSMYQLSSGLDIDLDIGDDVLPTIGLHSYYPGNDRRWRVLLDELVRRGICTPEKRDAALTWPGTSEVTLPGHKWPSTLHRTLEVKVVYREGEPIFAKAYLIFEYRLALFQ